MTPQQKAAITRKTNRDAKLATERRLVADLKANVQHVCDEHSGRHFADGGDGISCFVSVVANVGDRLMRVPGAAYGHGLVVDDKLANSLTAIGIESYSITLD